MQRAQSDDISRHADLCSNPLILNPGGDTRPRGYSCTKAYSGGNVLAHARSRAEEVPEFVVTAAISSC
jgi:hypothetical protein